MGINDPLVPSEALSEIVGEDPLTRGEAMSAIWAYYRENGLTPELKKIVGSKMEAKKVPGALSKHLFKIEDEE